MTYRTLVITVLGMGAAAYLAACSGDHSVAPSTSSIANPEEVQASEDVAAISANELSGDVADYQQAEIDAGLGFGFGPGNLQIRGPLGFGRFGWGLFPPGLGRGGWGWGPQAVVDGKCALDSVGFFFTFPNADPTDTIAYARTWQFFSASGCEPRFVADSTDSVAFTTAYIGDFNGDNAPWAGHHHGSSADALSGTQEPGTGVLLATAATHVWNGSATAFDSVMFSAMQQQRLHRWLAYDTTTNVTFPNPRHGDWFPSSGTWTRWLTDTVAVSGDTTSMKQYALHLVLTFTTASPGQGSQDATLKVYDSTTGALLATCTVDLRNAHIIPGSCHT
jgi:hypothetical protein